MKKWNIIFFIGIYLLGCSNKKTDPVTNEERRAELKQLLRRGYSIEELQIRTGCPSSYLYGSLCGKPIPKEYHLIIDSIYDIDKEGKLISASKIGLSARECIQKIFVKAQNLPIASQYTGIDVASICNELTNRKPFTIDDSLKAMISYIDNCYGFAQIPININVQPYFTDYYNEHEINKIKLPIDYSKRFKGTNSTQQAVLSYFVKQAEEFELEANKNLEKNINRIIEDYISNVTNDFIEKDVNSKINVIKVFFDSDEKREEFYLEKLNKRIREANLDSLLQTEILNYCISINCSRELAVNEMLGYNENIYNMNIVSNMRYDKYFSRIKGINEVYDEHAVALKSTAFMLYDFGNLVISFSLNKAGIAKSSVSVVKRISSLIYQTVQKNLSEDHIEIRDEKLNKYLQDSIRRSIMDYLNKNKDDYYKKVLDKNTDCFYEMLRNDFKIE